MVHKNELFPYMHVDVDRVAAPCGFIHYNRWGADFNPNLIIPNMVKWIFPILQYYK